MKACDPPCGYFGLESAAVRSLVQLSVRNQAVEGQLAAGLRHNGKPMQEQPFEESRMDKDWRTAELLTDEDISLLLSNFPAHSLVSLVIYDIRQPIP